MAIDERARDVLTNSYLSYLTRGFKTGEFSQVFEYLTEDCILTSYPEQYSWEPKSAVVRWLEDVGKNVAAKKTEYDVVIGPIHPFYVRGYKCDQFEMTGIYDKTMRTIFFISLSETGLIQALGFWEPLVFEPPDEESTSQ